jgi:nodulation protein E
MNPASASRVAITGIGVISSIGLNRDAFWDSVVRGLPGIRPMRLVDCGSLRFRNVAEVCGYLPENHFDDERLLQLDRFAQFGLVAAREAVEQSGVAWDPALRGNTAVVTGSALGGQTTQDAAFAGLYREGRTRFHPLNVPRVMSNAAASQISMEFGFGGPGLNVSTACASATHAIGQAFWMVRQGAVDAAVAGGTEAPISLGHLKAWEAMRVVSPDTCRPFSKGRDGLIIGEGAAMLLLERMDLAVGRGARVLGEIVGFGMSSDAHHLTAPSLEGAARAMKSALADAGLPPHSISYINAHGTGTPVNDPVETAAIREVFGPHAGRLAVSSTKSLHGHALGASGALEAAATVLGLLHAILPPTANFLEPDPECDLDVIPNEARGASCEYALSNSLAFGGLNAVLAFRGR